MRKYTILGIVFLISTLLLLGCSSDKEDENVASSETEENKEKVEQSSDEAADEGNSDDVDEEAEDIDSFIEEVTKVNKELKSYSTDSTTDTTQTFGEDKNHIIKVQQQETIFDPFQVKKIIKTEQQDDSDHGDASANEEMTMYIVDGINYVNLKTIFGDGKQWVKAKNKFSDEKMKEQEYINIKRLVEELSEIVTDKTLKEEDGTYILSFEFDVEKMTEIDKENPQLTQSEDEEVNQKVKDTYKIEQMGYQMKFDQESKLLLELETTKKHSFDMDFQDKTDTLETIEKTVTKYENQNKVDKIVVPDEAIENAVETEG